MDLKQYFKEAIDKGASDLHLIAGAPPAIRVDAELIDLNPTPVDNAGLMELIKSLFNEHRVNDFITNRELDASVTIFDHRLRVNLHYQMDNIGLAARLIKGNVPTADEAGFNDTIKNLTRLRDGLILVTGASGSGKSTTLAVMIEMINQQRRSHIITVEDPIEYIFENQKSIIEQREVGSDTLSFAEALRHILRQDPNVIMIGEMRDAETMSIALTAAETGHLVFSTLHTNSAADTVARIIDSFPTYRQDQVLSQLSLTLRAVIAQQLLPKVRGGLVAAREIMINNEAIASLIKRNQVGQIHSVIETSIVDGMIDLNKSIDLLHENGIIGESVARNRKRNLGTKATYYE
ncbi:MAG: PilT/PilU family type 4a pilus ATPase [bacterium]